MGKQRILSFVIAVCLANLPLLAQDQPHVKRGTPERRGHGWEERLEIGIAAREGGRLVLRTDMGTIVIRPRAGGRIDGGVVLRAFAGNEAEARRILGSFELSVRALEGGGVYVSGQSTRSRRHSTALSGEFALNVPQQFNLDVETQGGDITVENSLQGEARLTTAGGDIRTADIHGLLKAETAGGSITLGQMGNRVEARTAGGSIHVGDVKGDAVLETSGGEIVVGQVGGILRAETAGGDVVISSATGPVVAQTAGGQIQIGPAAGSVRAETAGGSIRLQGARGRVVAETAGGSIDLLEVQGGVKASTAAGRILAQWMGTKKTFGASELETAMGDVYVYLPVDLALNIDAAIDAAAGHRIVSDFPINIQGSEEDFAERTIRGRGALNGGGETLRIRTVSGNIEIRRLDAKGLQEFKNREGSTWKHWQDKQAEKERRRQENDQRRRERRQEPEDDE